MTIHANTLAPTLLSGRARHWLWRALTALCLMTACDGNHVPQDVELPDSGTTGLDPGRSSGPSLATLTSGSPLTSADTGWKQTGRLASERLLHTATRLQDGRVLVVGGYNRTAEVYDPATATWSPTGDAPGSFRGATATLLVSGKVLVAGAASGVSAALYDPATGTFAATGSLAKPRYHHTATRLPDGRVLVTGGADQEGSSGAVLASAEIYDPATNAWTAASAMSTGRRRHTATLLSSGKVLVAGGETAAGRLASAELYDPATGAWAIVSAMGTARASHTATLLHSGKVLLVGGGADGVAATRAELYDPATASFSAAPTMAQPRRRHSATLLANGRVLVAGGYDNTTGIQGGAELYDPVRGVWEIMPSLVVSRYHHTATLLANGRVLVTGGFTDIQSDQASAELFSAAYIKVLLDSGVNWQLVNISGAHTDGNAPAFSADMYIVDGALGVANAPLPDGVRAMLAARPDVEESGCFLDKAILDEIRISEQMGQLTPALQAIAVPAASPFAGLQGLSGGGCPDEEHEVGPDLNFARPLVHLDIFSGAGFTGTLDLGGEVRGSVQPKVKVRVPRYELFGACIPVGPIPEQFRVTGRIEAELGAILTGSLTSSHQWNKTFAEPHLGTIAFFIPGLMLPVVISVDLPIIAGIDIQGEATGTIQYGATRRAAANFELLCPRQGDCSTTSSIELPNLDFSDMEFDGDIPLSYGVQAHIRPSVWAKATVRADLYKSGTYVEVGVRPSLNGDLWGYWGNTCGDADGNGANEDVSALTADLSWRVDLLGAIALLSHAEKTFELWSTRPMHLGFWDLIGSTAIRPMLRGPASLIQRSIADYSISMRPCWPYGETMHYELDWGDGASEFFAAHPTSAVTRSHGWQDIGQKNVRVVAVQDTRGRVLNTDLLRYIDVTPVPPSIPNAQFVAQSVPSTMEPGGAYLATVTMVNNGDTTWATGTHFLGSQNPQDNTTWGFSRVALPHNVAPGEQVSISFAVTAPSQEGDYNFQWRMLQEGVGWFGDATTNVNVEVAIPQSGCDESACADLCCIRGYKGSRCFGDTCECTGWPAPGGEDCRGSTM